MNDIEFRKTQEAVANLLKCKDEIAIGAYELFKAYRKAGFTQTQGLKLIVAGFFGKDL